jgi:hypothetical protein
VAFSNQQSYIAAISARFDQLQHGEIDKRVGILYSLRISSWTSNTSNILLIQCKIVGDLMVVNTILYDFVLFIFWFFLFILYCYLYFGFFYLFYTVIYIFVFFYLFHTVIHIFVFSTKI